MNNNIIEKTDKTDKTKLTRVRKTGGIRKRTNTRRTKKQVEEEKLKKDFTAILEKINNCMITKPT